MPRHRLEAYLDKVFGFSALVSALPEGRQFPQHPWKKVFDAVFLGAAMQLPSLLQIEAECCEGALAKRIGPISDDTIDTEVFQTITTDCHLKHPAVHQTTAMVVLTMIRFLAYTLSLVFYHRQVRSHARGKCETFHECAKRIAYWFLAPADNSG